MKSLFKEVLLPCETPAATTAPEWIMGPSWGIVGKPEEKYKNVFQVQDLEVIDKVNPYNFESIVKPHFSNYEGRKHLYILVDP